jgi:hypothetical protein
MGLYNSFQTSPKLEKEGVWRDFGHCRVRVARQGGSNQKFNAHMEKVSKQHQRAIAQDLLGNARALAILETAYAETIITEWETNTNPDTEAEPVWVAGIENPDGGELLPVTPENIKRTLHALPDLFAELQEVAKGLQFYRQSLIDETAGN